jgi:hypothetical protein
MGAEVFAVPHVTATVPFPTFVVGSIFHVQDAAPSAPAVFGVSPCAVLTFPDGCV